MNISDLTIKSGLYMDAALNLSINIRDEEREDFEAQWDDVYTGIVSSANYSEFVVTVYHRQTPMAVFGVGSGDPGRPWAALSKDAVKYPVTLVKFFKLASQEMFKNFGDLENYVPAFDRTAVDLLEVSGFTVDYEETFKMHDIEYYRFFKRRD